MTYNVVFMVKAINNRNFLIITSQIFIKVHRVLLSRPFDILRSTRGVHETKSDGVSSSTAARLNIDFESPPRLHAVT